MNVAGLLASIESQAPAVERQRAVALLTADAMTCLALAASTEEARRLSQFYLTNGRGSKQDRAAAAAAIIRLSECDSIHVPSCLTPSAIVVPVAVALAREEEVFARAVQFGTAVGLWIAESIGGIRALEHGIWPTLLAAPAMASATASVALGLDPERVEHAVALAISGTSGRLGRPVGTPSGRWLAIAEAVNRGMRAAEAAAAGFRGDLGLFGRDWLEAQGASTISPVDTDRDALMRIGLKPFVAARQGMNALAALDGMIDGIDAAAIERIEVELPAECLPVITRPVVEGDRLSRIANLAHRMAAAAVDKESLLDPEGSSTRPDLVRSVADAVSVLPAEMPVVAGSWPARVRMLVEGEWREAQGLCCPGDAGDMNSQATVVARKLSALAPDRCAMLQPLVDARASQTILNRAQEVLHHLA